MPCLRHTSAVFAPASCSCRIAMICSSLNRLRFIVRPPSGGRTLLKSGGASGAQVRTCRAVENLSVTGAGLAQASPLSVPLERKCQCDADRNMEGDLEHSHWWSPCGHYSRNLGSEISLVVSTFEG